MLARLVIRVPLALAVLLAASPLYAQFRPRMPVTSTAVGEDYWIEAAAGFWNPTSDMAISSESLGIVGSTIDFKGDLGLTDQRFREVHLTLRPSRRHKFRFQYIPIKYGQEATLTRDIVFNGQRYRVGLPVASVLDWKAYRLGYEFDFISNDRGFAGFVLDFKQTDVTASLDSPLLSEFAQAQAPIPAIGGIFRVYLARGLSITGEITGFRLPENLVDDAEAHFLDVDFYGTYNFTNNVGAQVGYRRFDVRYLVEHDSGDFDLRGLYFGGVLRY